MRVFLTALGLAAALAAPAMAQNTTSCGRQGALDTALSAGDFALAEQAKGLCAPR